MNDGEGAEAEDLKEARRELAWPVYLVDLRSEGLTGADVVLTGREAEHAGGSRRHRVGEWLVAADGSGAWVAGPVAAVHRDEVRIAVRRRGYEPASALELTVVQAIPKSDEAVDLLTQIGVDHIVAWQAERCVARWQGPERVDRGRRRWERVAAEASKQSRRVRIPTIAGPLATHEVAALISAVDTAWVCHESATEPLVAQPVPTHGRAVLIVGPEGGVADAELDALTAAGAAPVSLGPTVLRSVLAGTVAASLVLGRTGRLG